MRENYVKKVIENINDYEQSLQASLAFIHLYKWDQQTSKIRQNVIHYFGKVFNPGSVTPDISILLDNKRGIVIEVKSSLPRNESNENNDLWIDIIEQLSKYDKKLKGWETDNKNVSQQELVLLMNQKFVVKFKNYLKSKQATFENHNKNFSIMQYGPAPGHTEAIFIQKREGSIDDFNDITDERFDIGIPIARKFLINSGLFEIKFMDNEPPSEYLMDILWKHIFSSKIPENEWREARVSTNKQIKIKVNIINLTKELAKHYTDQKSTRCIKKKWIDKALRNFVALKLAEKDDKQNIYYIKYRKQLKGITETQNQHEIFAELLYEHNSQKTMDDFIA